MRVLANATAMPERVRATPRPPGIRNQFHHVIYIVPTILEMMSIRAPQTVNGITQTPIEGVSLAYIRQGERRRSVEAFDPVFRDVRQSSRL